MAGATPALKGSSHAHTITNWAATHSASPYAYYEPTSVEEIQSIVRVASAEGRVVRAVGSGHSPNDCVMTNDVIVSLRKFKALLVLDLERQLVKTQAGITLEELNEVLASHGLALPILGSISEQTIAGCISTGTHGSGIKKGIIATNIVELQLVLASGEAIVTSRRQRPELFHAALCSFGCLGIITGVVLQAVPAFDIYAIENRDNMTSVLRDLRTRVTSAPFYRFWWFPHTDHVWEWRGYPVPPHQFRDNMPAAFEAARETAAATEQDSPTHALAKSSTLKELNSRRRTRQMLESVVPGWMFARGVALWDWFWFTVVGYHVYQFLLWIAVFFPIIIPSVNALFAWLLFWDSREATGRSDRMFNFDCKFRQHVDEWAIPVESLAQAMASLKSMLDTSGYKVDFPVEVRFVAGDDIWLSPSYGRPTAYIGIIRYKPYGVEVDYQDYFRRFEEIMISLSGRPHWAKDFSLRGDADFQRIYAKWHDFKRLREELDPEGVFVNDFVRRTLGLSSLRQRSVGATSISDSAASTVASQSSAGAAAALAGALSMKSTFKESRRRLSATRIPGVIHERDSDAESASEPVPLSRESSRGV